MDETEKLDAGILKGLFDQGVSIYIKQMCKWITILTVSCISSWVSKLKLIMMVPTVLSPLLSSPLKVIHTQKRERVFC